MLSPAVDNLVAQLTRLPGIGTRTAQRLAFHILAAPTDEANAIGSAIADVKARVTLLTRTWASVGQHTIRIQVAGSGRPVAIDEFVVTTR